MRYLNINNRRHDTDQWWTCLRVICKAHCQVIDNMYAELYRIFTSDKRIIKRPT